MFEKELKKELLNSSYNFYNDNYDYYTHGKEKLKKKFINSIKWIIFSPIFIKICISNEFLFKKILLKQIYNITDYLDKLESFYNLLENDESKKLLLKLVAFRVLGYKKVKLPLSNKVYFKGIEEVNKIKNLQDFISLPYKPYKIFKHDLSPLNKNVKIYLHSNALYTTFLLPHYKLSLNDGKYIGAEKGDVVLDLGGCYGDTALFFSDVVGNTGKIYSFEFIPSNIEIFKKNLALNPHLKEQITLINNPVWDKSNIEVFYKDLGAGSKVQFEKFEGYDGITKTIAIDDFVDENKIQKVDFIKTDIEGAEPYFIKGAKETIRKFKPKLAISIYHGMDDFTGIIQQIAELNLGYKFYLGHATIYASETVLFCKVSN